MFGRTGVSMRMFISVTVVVMLYAGTFLMVGTSLSDLARVAGKGNEENFPKMLLADDLILSHLEVRQYLTDISSKFDREKFKGADGLAKRFMNDVEKLKQLFHKDIDENGLRQIKAIEASFNQFYSSGIVLAEAYLSSAGAEGHPMTNSDLTTEFDKNSKTIANLLEIFRHQQFEEVHKVNANIANNAHFTFNVMVAGGSVASLIAAFFGLWITRSILGKMGGEPAYAADVVKSVAGGDLSIDVNIKGGDTGSMLFAVKDMIYKLSRIVSNIRNSTESITAGLQEITSFNTDLSKRTEEQGSSLDETASSMQELLSAVRQNAESARQAYRLAQGSCDVAEQSGDSVAMLVTTMTSINESSKKIEDIISVIDGIAFQTNILALNAAVEAARAGEHGRGFAVVAAEVRNLAQRSASAAKEIKILIGGSRENVSTGTNQVKEASEMVSDVVTSVQLVASLMKEISNTTTEQSMNIEQVNSAIVQIDKVTQQNAALVEKAASSAESMREKAESLMQEIMVFKLEATRTLSRDAAQSVDKSELSLRSSKLISPLLPTPARKDAENHGEKVSNWKEF